MQRLAIPPTLLVTALTVPAMARAGDDPSIVEPLRTQIRDSMAAFVEYQMIDGVVRHYDPVSGSVLRRELRARPPEVSTAFCRLGRFSTAPASTPIWWCFRAAIPVFPSATVCSRRAGRKPMRAKSSIEPRSSGVFRDGLSSARC